MSVDTLTLAQRLRAAELPVEHAEAIAAAIGSAVLEGAATKDDLTAAKTDLKSDIAAVRAELRSDIQLAGAGLETKVEQLRTEIERSRNQIVIGFVSTQIALVGVVIAAIKFL